jgi:hypothetical protein
MPRIKNHISDANENKGEMGQVYNVLVRGTRLKYIIQLIQENQTRPISAL